MFDTALSTINKYNMIQSNDHIIIALSGGADSMSLLYFLNEIKDKFLLKLTAVHINHGIRGDDAFHDELFIKDVCLNLNIDLETYHYDIPKFASENKLTVEEAGRQMRYKSFFETKNKIGANKIAVAHNMNDNCETVLFNICRGTGIKGLCGIPAVRASIIRPLINCSRDKIEKYCLDNNINFVVDSSNSDDKYTRNNIRINLIPWIENEINSNIVKSISRMSELLAEDEQFINSIVENAYKQCVVKESEDICCLDIPKLTTFEHVIQKKTIRCAVKSIKPTLKDINFTNINDVITLLNKDTGKFINLSGGIIVKKSYNSLIFSRNEKSSSYFCYNLMLNEKLFVPELNKFILLSLVDNADNIKNYTKFLDYDKITFNIQLRSRNTGDKIYLRGVGNKKLSDFFTDKKIPLSKRDSIPILANGKDVIWIIGYRISDKYKNCAGAKKILKIELLED